MKKWIALAVVILAGVSWAVYEFLQAQLRFRTWLAYCPLATSDDYEQQTHKEHWHSGPRETNRRKQFAGAIVVA